MYLRLFLLAVLLAVQHSWAQVQPKPLNTDTIPAAKQLTEVIVSGAAEQIKKEQSLNIEVVNAAYIKRNLGGSLMQSLQRLPGVKHVAIGAGNSKPLLRGLGFNQVAVIENGIRHEGQQWGADHGLEIDQYAVQRVEVVKGPASFLYGSDAIGGAINIRPAPLPAAHSLGGAIDLTGRSNNQQLGGSANIYGRSKRFFFDTRLTVQDYGDYRVPTNEVHVYNFAVPLYKNQVRNTAGRELNVHASVGYVGERFTSILYYSDTYNKSGFFANAHGLEPRKVDAALHDRSSRDIQLPYQEVNHRKLINRTLLKLGEHNLELQAGYQNNFRREWSHYVNHGYMPPLYPAEQTAPHTLERQYDKHVWSLNIKDVLITGRHELTVGINTEAQTNTIGGWGFLIPGFTQVQGGAFVYDKITVNDRLLVHGALRFDAGRIRIKAYNDWFPSLDINNGDTTELWLQRAGNLERNFNNLTWSTGANYNLNKLSLKLNMGTSFRMPIAKELAVNGVNYHYFRYEKGNEGLSPERSYQLDAGISWQEKSWSVQLTPFVNYFSNYIYLNPTARMDHYYGAGNQVFEYAQARVVRYGAELQAKYFFTPQWSTEVLAEYIYNQQRSGSKAGYTLPFTPPPSVLFNLSYEPVFRKFISDAYVSLDYRIAAMQHRIVPPEKKTPGYQLVTIAAGGKLLWRKLPVTFNLQVQNLFNTRYLNHTSFYRLIEVPEMGRNLIVSLRLPFSLLK